MPIQVQCTDCGKRYQVADQFAGKRAKCQNCGATLVVPEPVPTTQPGAKSDFDVAGALPQDADPIAVAPGPAAPLPTATRFTMPVPPGVPGPSTARQLPPARIGFRLNRVVIILLVIGGMLIFFGAREWQLSSVASPVPQNITCLQLEKNGPGNNAHVHLTKFFALKNFVFQKHDASANDYSIVWIPVTAEDGGYITGIKMKAMFGQISSEDEVAPPSDIKVIVKSNRIKNLQDEAAFARRRDVRGMVINKIESLSSKERELLRPAYPGVDFNKCWIIEEGREPAGAGKYLGFFGGGAALILLGLYLMLKPQ